MTLRSCRVRMRPLSTTTLTEIDVVVQFYPWFKFSFLLFQTHYHVIIIHFHTQKQKKRKFEPRIKLNHNIDIHDVSSVSTNDFSSPGALCDDQSSTQTKRGVMYTVSTSQQTESTIQQQLAGIFR